MAPDRIDEMTPLTTAYRLLTPEAPQTACADGCRSSPAGGRLRSPLRLALHWRCGRPVRGTSLSTESAAAGREPSLSSATVGRRAMETTTATPSRMTVTTARMATPRFGAVSPERIDVAWFSGCRSAAGGFGAVGGSVFRRGPAAGFSGCLSAAVRSDAAGELLAAVVPRFVSAAGLRHRSVSARPAELLLVAVLAARIRGWAGGARYWCAGRRVSLRRCGRALQRLRVDAGWFGCQGSRSFLPQLPCQLPQAQFTDVAGALALVAIGAGLARSKIVRPHVHYQVSEIELLAGEHVFAFHAAGEDRRVDADPGRSGPLQRRLVLDLRLGPGFRGRSHLPHDVVG